MHHCDHSCTVLWETLPRLVVWHRTHVCRKWHCCTEPGDTYVSTGVLLRNHLVSPFLYHLYPEIGRASVQAVHTIS